MKLGYITAVYFGSYLNLALDLSNTGTALLYGPTGSGKSSIMDAVAWALFGCTAKGGTADEVRAWGVDDPTEVELEVDSIRVFRCRGKASQNDLYWTEEGSDTLHRGKDLTDTQKLLEKRLGVSKELFLTGAYFHEFSDTGNFFLAKAKDRRQLLERISDLSLPVKISEACVLHKKAAKAEISSQQMKLSKAQGKLEQLIDTEQSYRNQKTYWDDDRDEVLANIKNKALNFNVDKAAAVEAIKDKIKKWESSKTSKIDAILDEIDSTEATIKADVNLLSDIEKVKASSKCRACGSLNAEAAAELKKLERSLVIDKVNKNRLEEIKERLREADAATHPYDTELDSALSAKNTYEEVFAQEQAKTNPFSDLIIKTQKDVIKARKEEADAKKELELSEQRHANLTSLYDLSFDLRGALLLKAVKEIEDSANKYLDSYFDAEIRVGFSVEDGDSIEVDIQVEGNTASYTQLSKGQRQLLKLCFAVSVMKAAANNSGVHFDNLFLDESLDGLDSELKIKAYRLFEELSTDHASVLVIDHSPELQNLFTKRYRVEKTEHGSELINESEN